MTKSAKQTKKRSKLPVIKPQYEALISVVNEKILLFKGKLIWAFQWVEYQIAIRSFLITRFFIYKLHTAFSKFGLLAFALGYCIVLGFSLLWLNKFFVISMPIDPARDFFTATGAMVGGTLAIVVSFALFTVQQASEQFPKDFFRLATDLKKYLIIFLADVSITFGLFCAALTYGSLNWGLSGWAINIGLFLIGVSFLLILILLYQVKNDVDKDKILVKAVNKLINTVKQVHTRSIKLAQAQLLHPANRGRFTLDQVLARVYQSPSLTLQFQHLKRELDYLFDYHDSFLASNQKRAALEVLEGIRAVVSSYLEVRKNSSIAFPEANSLFMLTSDSQFVLQPILDRAISLGEDYMKRGDTAGIIATVNVFINWANQAAEIQFVGLDAPENPILEQITGYFSQMMERAINHNSLEGMYQGLRFYKTISVLCVQKSHLHILSSLVKKVEDLAIKGFTSRQDPVIVEAFATYSEVLRAVINHHPFSFEYYFMLLDDHINTLIRFGYAYTINGTLRDNMTAQQDVSKPHKMLEQMIFYAQGKASEATEPEDIDRWQRLSVDITEELRKSLRILAEEMKKPSHMLVHTFSAIIQEVGLSLVRLAAEPSWSNNRNALIVEARAYVHLPPWFLSDAAQIEGGQSVDALFEAITKIGLESLQHTDMDDLTEQADKVLTGAAMNLFDKPKTIDIKHLQVEIMEQACYIGILALKNNKTTFVHNLKTKILEFEQKYLQAYYTDNLPPGSTPYTVNPPADKLKRRIDRLHSERRAWTGSFGMGMMEDSKDVVLALVSVADVQNFISKIWGEQQ